MYKEIYLSKTLALIDSELKLFRMKIKHPEQFTQSTEPTFKSDLHIVPKSHDLGIIGLLEITVALHLSGHILGSDGKPAPLTQISRVFEHAFNVSFGNIYDRRIALFNRKRSSLTKALDRLQECLEEERRKQNLR